MAASAYGKSGASVRSTVRRGIHRAYARDPEHFSEVLDELLLSPPRTRDFVAMAVRRLRENGARMDGTQAP